MKYRRLGNSGLKVSEISLGGWLTFGNAVDKDRGAAIIAKAFDLGINFFDTANVYARGKCEEMWGELFQPYTRSSYVLATKAFGAMADGPNDRGLSRKHLTEQCHASLKRLRTDYIDLYQCHRYDEETPIEETVSTMNDLVRQGKVLYWGFSEWTVEQIARTAACCGTRFERPVSSQPQYNLLQRQIEHGVFPLCRELGIGHVVWSPLAQGLLTGKYKPGAAPTPETRAGDEKQNTPKRLPAVAHLPAGSRAADDKQNQFIKDKAQDAELLERIARLEPIAKEAGCTMAQLALAWILSHAEISSAIVGASRPEQLVENAAASTITLDPSIIERTEKALV